MFLIVYLSIESGNPYNVDTHNIRDFQDPPALVEKIVAKLRGESFTEPERTIKRLGDTNFILISTLPSETLENKSSWLVPYHLKMETLKFKETNIALQKDDKTVNLTINFESKSNPYADDFIIEDRQLTTPELFTKLKATIKEKSVNMKELNMNELNTPENNLNEVIFDKLHYIGASFEKSSLIEASFDSADFVLANFTSATLHGANFYGADLRKTNFNKADLTPALKEDGTTIPCDLRFANLKYADLEGADLTGCKMQGAKLYGTNWTESICDVEYIQRVADFNKDDKTNVEIAEIAATKENDGRVAAEDVLDPLELNLQDAIPESKSDDTYDDIVQLLLPQINSVKMPLSAMILNQWYGIASLGTTRDYVWESVGLVDPVPAIGMRFKCIDTVEETPGEAQVYDSGPDCMAIHELVRKIDIKKVLTTFQQIVGTKRLQAATLADNAKLLNKVTQEMYQLVVFLLGYHLADEAVADEAGADEAGEDAWTHVYNTGPENFQKRSQLVKHAIYHKDEGLIVHSLFDFSLGGTPDNLLIIIEFLKMLPLQVQVAWAQNYIKEFITGYGQTLEDFDPQQEQGSGFIASCINGNFEKMLMAIRTAIVQFAHTERPPAYTDEERNQDIRKAVTGSVFEKYFAQERDPSGATIDRYIKFIKATYKEKPELKVQYESLLEDPEIIRALNETIDVMSGGRRSRRKAKIRKTLKKTKKPKKTLKKTKKSKKISKKTKKTKKTKKNKLKL